MKTRNIIVILVVMSFTLGFNEILLAQGKAKAKRKGITGEVSAISKDFIAIVYDRNVGKGSEEEICLPIAKNVIIEHKKSLDQIAVGDTVYVEFDEVSEQTDSGERTKRIAGAISFVRAAPKPAKTAMLDSAKPSQPEEEEE